MLSGLRIVEFEALGPAPFAAMTLADLGAEVIVIHRKSGGETPGKPSHNILDRGKKSIALDLKSAKDLEIAQKLIASADGLIEGFRPGVMERLGLGPDALLSTHKHLVYGRMTGWGQTGPRAQQAGHDLNYISLTGALWYASNPGEPPFTPPTLVGDIGGGALYLVVGMLSALIRARQSGKGSVVDAAIVDGTAHMMALLLSLRSSGGLQTERGQSTLDGPHWSRCYACKGGGYISVQCLEPKFYVEFLRLLSLDQDVDFQKQFDKSLWPELGARLAGIFAGKSQDYWQELFAGTDACVAPVLSLDGSVEDPHMIARQIWQHTQGHLQPAPAPRFSAWTPPDPAHIHAKDVDRKEILEDLRKRDEDAASSV